MTSAQLKQYYLLRQKYLDYKVNKVTFAKCRYLAVDKEKAPPRESLSVRAPLYAKDMHLASAALLFGKNKEDIALNSFLGKHLTQLKEPVPDQYCFFCRQYYQTPQCPKCLDYFTTGQIKRNP